MSKYQFGSIVDRDFRNTLQRVADEVEVHGKTIQDLVAEGQLTPEQYAGLVSIVNGNLKSGEVGKLDLKASLRSELDSKRDNSKSIDLDDLSSRTVDAISGGEGANFNLLSVPRHRSVSPEKTTFFSASSNLVDENDFTPRHTIDPQTGELTPNSTVDVSGFIPIDPGAPYTSHRVIRKGFYDEVFNFISSDTVSGTWVAPENAYYVRVVSNPAYWGTELQLNFGKELLPYERYYMYLDRKVIEGSDILDRLNYISNLFDGYVSNLTVSVDESVNFVYPSTSGNVRTAIVPIERNQQYEVEAEGPHNRFLIAVTNSPTENSPLERRHYYAGGDVTHSKVKFSSGQHSYALITVSSQNQEPNLRIYKEEVPDQNSALLIDGERVMMESDIESISPKYMDKYSDRFTTDILPSGVHGTYNEAYNIMDDLMAQSDGYIIKKEEGQDALGNPMNSYTAKTKRIHVLPDQTPSSPLKIGVLTGLHGNEKNTFNGFHRFLEVLTFNEVENELLQAIKKRCEFYFLPVGNPSGWNANTRNNHNDINLNRDFNDKTQAETQVIFDWMVKNDLDYVLDYHNTSTTEERLTWVTGGLESHAEMSKHYWMAITDISDVWTKRWNTFPNNVIFGSIHGGSSIGATKNGAEEAGALGCTLETPWAVPYNGGGNNSATANTISAELIGNMIIAIYKSYEFRV